MGEKEKEGKGQGERERERERLEMGENMLESLDRGLFSLFAFGACSYLCIP
jgi:hypothetical protein